MGSNRCPWLLPARIVRRQSWNILWGLCRMQFLAVYSCTRSLVQAEWAGLQHRCPTSAAICPRGPTEGRAGSTHCGRHTGAEPGSKAIKSGFAECTRSPWAESKCLQSQLGLVVAHARGEGRCAAPSRHRASGARPEPGPEAPGVAWALDCAPLRRPWRRRAAGADALRPAPPGSGRCGPRRCRGGPLCGRRPGARPARPPRHRGSAPPPASCLLPFTRSLDLSPL